ncbi:SDR family NAD(P)-dependent oxidoreductase [Halorientalis sp.]|uniref:SDR family NAD(P)-dependent oxidoreductase n=1 Tax=Halorientalis sp. TaxID=1931229 RepID=UPI0026376427|nr:SDR family oxidoreductase [Halorientalis sp.]
MTDSTVLVTGASRGIGAAVAETFGSAGWRVVLCSRSRSELEDVAAAVSDAGGTPVVKPLDVTDADEFYVSLLEAVDSALDVVIPAAATTTGPPGQQPLDEETHEGLRAVMDTNVYGVFAVIRESLQFMPEDGRVLVPSGSVAREPVEGMGAYGVSKAAVEGVARSFAADAKQTVGIVDPGLVATELTDQQGRDPQEVAELFRWAGTECAAPELNGAVVGLKKWKQATR